MLYGGKKVYLPLSSYCDLANAHKFSITTTVDGFLLMVNGGDAHGSFDAKIVIDHGLVTMRSVRHGEFPGVVWEETFYSYNTLDN